MKVKDNLRRCSYCGIEFEGLICPNCGEIYEDDGYE